MRLKQITGMFILLVACMCVQASSLPIPAPPEFEASSYVLMDYGSGSVLADQNSMLRIDPASLTKIMTTYVVYKALAAKDAHLEDQVLISEKAWRSIGSRMFVEVGERVLLEDLLLGLIIQSGNDSSVALAEHIAGTEEAFADVMNVEAQRLGLEGTHFTNSTGLPDPDHYTTAYDVAVMSRALISEFPEEYKRYAEKEFTFNGIKQYNRNRLLWRDAAVDGLKTGYTESAGYCLAASAIRNDMRLISVVTGTKSSKSRVVNTQALLNYGFRYYESHQLYKAEESLVNQRMWGGESELVQLGLAEDLFVTIPRGKYESLKATMNIQSDILAPVEEGDQVGTVKVTFDGHDFSEKPLVTLHSNPQGGWWRRIVDFFLKFFH